VLAALRPVTCSCTHLKCCRKLLCTVQPDQNYPGAKEGIVDVVDCGNMYTGTARVCSRWLAVPADRSVPRQDRVSTHRDVVKYTDVHAHLAGSPLDSDAGMAWGAEARHLEADLCAMLFDTVHGCTCAASWLAQVRPWHTHPLEDLQPAAQHSCDSIEP